VELASHSDCSMFALRYRNKDVINTHEIYFLGKPLPKTKEALSLVKHLQNFDTVFLRVTRCEILECADGGPKMLRQK
jgi:hypothetical protein